MCLSLPWAESLGKQYLSLSTGSTCARVARESRRSIGQSASMAFYMVDRMVRSTSEAQVVAHLFGCPASRKVDAWCDSIVFAIHRMVG